MKSKLTVFILLVALFCFGCGSNEHEIELETDDKYDYSGTWIGQTSPTSFLILNICRADEAESPYKYALVNAFYYLKIQGNPSERLIALSWEIAPDIRDAVVLKDREELTLETGLTLNGGGLRDTNLQWRQMRRDGKYLIPIPVGGNAKGIKFSRVDDYDDFLDDFADIKKKIYADFKKDAQSRVPNINVSIIDEIKPPKTIFK